VHVSIGNLAELLLNQPFSILVRSAADEIIVVRPKHRKDEARAMAIHVLNYDLWHAERGIEVSMPKLYSMLLAK